MEETEKIEEAPPANASWELELKKLRAEAAKRRVQNKQLEEQLEALQAEKQQQDTEAARKRGEFEQLWREEQEKHAAVRAQLAIELSNGERLREVQEAQATELLGDLGMSLESLGLTQEDSIDVRLAALRAARLQSQSFRQAAQSVPVEKMGSPPEVDEAAVRAQMRQLLVNDGSSPHAKLMKLQELEKQLR